MRVCVRACVISNTHIIRHVALVLVVDCSTAHPPPGCRLLLRLQLDFYKIFFYFQSFVHESIVLSFFRPACIAHAVAILFHDYWAIYDPPSTSLLFAIHLTLLIITISCKS